MNGNPNAVLFKLPAGSTPNRFQPLKMNICYRALLLLCVLNLASCQPSGPGPVQHSSATTSPSATPDFTKMGTVPSAPQAEMPAPENTARMMDILGERVLASQHGDYSAHLKRVEDNIDVRLIKAGNIGEPTYSTGAVSGPGDFESRILKDILTHPEFRKPLIEVLAAATGQTRPDELNFTQAQVEIAKRLLSAVEETD